MVACDIISKQMLNRTVHVATMSFASTSYVAIARQHQVSTSYVAIARQHQVISCSVIVKRASMARDVASESFLLFCVFLLTFVASDLAIMAIMLKSSHF